MTKRRPFVVGNWKMNGGRDFAAPLAAAVATGVADYTGVDVAVCPPFTSLAAVAEVVNGTAVGLGAQDVSEFEDGPYTGEISTAMLQDLGCGIVIVGHSERRHIFGEGDSQVIAKLERAVRAGLTPILCIGETLAERQTDATEAVIDAQLAPLLEHAEAPALLAASVLAYEPVWAIGTGETATPKQAQSVHRYLRNRIAAVDLQQGQAIRLLYGGSVKPDNAGQLFDQTDIDGGLIGGASLVVEDFLAIVRAAAG